MGSMKGPKENHRFGDAKRRCHGMLPQQGAFQWLRPHRAQNRPGCGNPARVFGCRVRVHPDADLRNAIIRSGQVEAQSVPFAQERAPSCA